MTNTKTTKSTKSTKTRKAKVWTAADRKSHGQRMRDYYAGKRAHITRVALYLRGNDDASIALQRAHCMAYVAKRSGLTVTAEYCDIGHARTEHSPDRQHSWDRLRQDADAQAFDIVVTYTVSRITRSLSILSEILNRRDFAQRIFFANTDAPLIQD